MIQIESGSKPIALLWCGLFIKSVLNLQSEVSSKSLGIVISGKQHTKL